MTADLLLIQPGELKFAFEVRRQISCSIQLVNTTDKYVAFKVKTTSPKKYCVRPNTGVVLPMSTCDVTVTMQAQREAPPDMQCKDKFLVQSVILPEGVDHKDIPQDIFNKGPGKEVYESKLRVVYVPPPQPPSPVPESAEEGVSPRPSLNLENGFDLGSDGGSWKAKLAEAQSQIARLTEEKRAALQKSQQLQEELNAFASKGSMAMQQTKVSRGLSFFFVLLIGLLGLLVGYFTR